MHFKKLVLDNFMSFRGRHEIDIDKGTGLHFLTGKNLVEPRLGSNAAGKSSIWNSFYWCITGKTLRNLRAGNIRSRDTNGSASVELTLQVSDVDVGIHRSWNPNGLYLKRGEDDWQQCTDQDILSVIPLTEEEIKNSIIIGQFNPLFFELQPAQKLSLFSTLLGLDEWLNASESAQQYWRGQESKCDKLTSELDRLDGHMGALEEDIDTKKEELKELKKSSKDHKDGLNVRLRQHSKSIEKVEKSLSKLQKDLDKKEKEESALIDDFGELTVVEEAIESINQSIEIFNNDRVKYETQLSALEEEGEELNSVKGVCPQCKQKVSREHIKTKLAEIGAKRNTIEKDLAGLGAKIDQAKQEKEEYVDIKKELKEEASSIKSEMKDLASQRSEKERELSKLQREVERFESELEGIDNRTKDYEEQIAKLEERRSESAKQHDKKKEELEYEEGISEAYKFWVKGFKEVRLMLIEEAISTFEFEVNNILPQIGLDDWLVKFEMERETKSGTVSKGFHVYIQSPDSDELVPWEAWSGGESQRLRLAGTMGLSELILNNRNVTTNLEVWDEPSAHLSAEGVRDLLELLKQRAYDKNRAVWLVEHTAMDYGGFSSNVVIEKDSKGSRVVED